MAEPLRIVMRALRGFVEKQVKAVTLDATSNLIEDTPRKTGWARSNWVPRIGKAHEGTVGTPQSVSSAAQQAGMASVAATYRLEQGPIIISNHVPYIIPLNDGHSKQAPAGFVQLAILRAVRANS